MPEASQAGGHALTHPLAQYRLCYLATPYSKYEKGLYQAFEDACRISARLLTRGVKVYSPIAHTHPIAMHGGLDPLDHKIWLPFDEAMMRVADALVVAQMDGWRESYGVRHEITYFASECRPIVYLDPDTLNVSELPLKTGELCPTP